MFKLSKDNKNTKQKLSYLYSNNNKSFNKSLYGGVSDKFVIKILNFLNESNYLSLQRCLDCLHVAIVN